MSTPLSPHAGPGMAQCSRDGSGELGDDHAPLFLWGRVWHEVLSVASAVWSL